MSIRLNNKDMRTLAGYAEAKGWEVTRTSSHVQFTSPDGKRVTTSSTPSDWRTLRNTVADLRRAGLEIPHKVSKAKTKVDSTGPYVMPGFATIPAFKVSEYPHIEAILGQWREGSWFDETGQPLSDDQWDFYTLDKIGQAVMAAWMETAGSKEVPPRRKFSIATYAAKFWYVGEPDDDNFPTKCECGQDFKLSTHSVMALAAHIVEYHERCEYDHAPVGDFLRPWVDPADVFGVLDDEQDIEIARLQAVVEAQTGWLRLEREKIDKVKDQLRVVMSGL